MRTQEWKMMKYPIHLVGRMASRLYRSNVAKAFRAEILFVVLHCTTTFKLEMYYAWYVTLELKWNKSIRNCLSLVCVRLWTCNDDQSLMTNLLSQWQKQHSSEWVISFRIIETNRVIKSFPFSREKLPQTKRIFFSAFAIFWHCVLCPHFE